MTRYQVVSLVVMWFVVYPAERASCQTLGAPTTVGGPVAIVEGVPLTEADLRESGGAALARVEEEAYRARLAHLDELIGIRLMMRDASRRGVSIGEYERLEIESKVPAVSERDIDAFFEANKARLSGNTPDGRKQIESFLSTQRRRARRAEVLRGLRATSTVDLRLPAPIPFRANVEVADAPIRGEVAAPITIVEFSDFHCPYCRRVQQTLASLLEAYKGQIRIAYKHMPLDGLHPNARRVSEAAWCADQQAKFWAFHDAVFADATVPADASEDYIARHAKAVGLSLPEFNRCLADGRSRASVERNAAEAAALGVSSTPWFFINGREIQGARPREDFVRIIEDELMLDTKVRGRQSGAGR